MEINVSILGINLMSICLYRNRP